MSSPFLTQFRKGGISREMRLTAASGALPLSAVDQVELLSLLSRDRDRKVSLGAISSLKSLEVALVTSVIKEPSINLRFFLFLGAILSQMRSMRRLCATPILVTASLHFLCLS